MAAAPAFSIIVPVFNAVEFLEECLDSILSQSFRDFELLLIDDGSTDGSSQLCVRYAEADGRISLLTQRNLGVSAARNLGLARASGDYIWMVDADDQIRPGALETLSEYTLSRRDLYVFNQRDTARLEQPSFHDLLEMHLDYRLGFQCWNKLYANTLLRRAVARFDDEVSIGEDLLFNVRLYSSVMGLEFIPADLYRYREHSDSAMRASSLNTRFADHMMVLGKVLEQAPVVDPTQRSRLLLMHLMSGIVQSGTPPPDSKRALADKAATALRDWGRDALPLSSIIAFLRAEEAGPTGWVRLLAVHQFVRWGKFRLSSRILIH